MSTQPRQTFVPGPMSQCVYNDNDPKCPYCGYVFKDGWEWGDHGVDECGECGKTFAFYRDVSISFSTRPGKMVDVKDLMK